MFLLGKKIEFPDVELASPDGILAIGGDLSPERLLLAYRNGIFPWYSEGEPIVWYSPEKRMVLFPEEIKVSKSMKQLIRRGTYHITWNENFEEVIKACQESPRKDQDGTWITEEMRLAYIRLHEMGHAKSVEVWREEELVGGLYGIDLGHVFCGESMFSREANTSKFAFINLAERLEKDNYRLIDCQVYTAHLASLGALEIPRKEFTKLLRH
jgi:leucyl/phenylalanyl-tRNA--protein transferase